MSLIPVLLITVIQYSPTHAKCHKMYVYPSVCHNFRWSQCSISYTSIWQFDSELAASVASSTQPDNDNHRLWLLAHQRTIPNTPSFEMASV